MLYMNVCGAAEAHKGQNGRWWDEVAYWCFAFLFQEMKLQIWNLTSL